MRFLPWPGRRVPAGRIDGVVYYGACPMDLELDPVAWAPGDETLRKWNGVEWVTVTSIGVLRGNGLLDSSGELHIEFDVAPACLVATYGPVGGVVTPLTVTRLSDVEWMVASQDATGEGYAVYWMAL